MPMTARVTAVLSSRGIPFPAYMVPGKLLTEVKTFDYQRISNTAFTHLPSKNARRSRRPCQYRRLCQSQSGGLQQICHRNPWTHRFFSKVHRTRIGQVGHHAIHLLFCAQLCKDWPSPLASPSSCGSWDRKPKTLQASDSQALEVVPSKPEIRCVWGEHPSPRAAAGHTPGNVKTTRANKAPEPGGPVPWEGHAVLRP